MNWIALFAESAKQQTMESVTETVQTILGASPKAIPAPQFSHLHKLKSLAVSAKRPDLLGSSREEKALIHQWIELAVDHLSGSFSSSSLIDDLDAVLRSRAFLVGARLTLADLVLFAATHAHFAAVSFLDKEKHLNASRWFSHVQNSIGETGGNRAKLPNVTFVRNRLYYLAL